MNFSLLKTEAETDDGFFKGPGARSMLAPELLAVQHSEGLDYDPWTNAMAIVVTGFHPGEV